MYIVLKENLEFKQRAICPQDINALFVDFSQKYDKESQEGKVMQRVFISVTTPYSVEAISELKAKKKAMMMAPQGTKDMLILTK